MIGDDSDKMGMDLIKYLEGHKGGTLATRIPMNDFYDLINYLVSVGWTKSNPGGVMPTGSTVGVHSEDGELDTIECPTFDLPDCDPLHDCEFSERCDVCFTMSKYRCKKYAIWEGQKPKPSAHEPVTSDRRGS